MFRILISIFILSIAVYADKKVEIFSKEVLTDGAVMKATSDIVVLYDGMYVSADAGTFDRDTGILELTGNVNALKGAEYYTIGDYLMINTKENVRRFRPFYFQERKDNLWIASKSATSIEQKYNIYTGLISSCNPQDPDWTMHFSSAHYDKEDKWMELYNARLYAGDVPIFYFPYFAYPTDTTRRTGLLRPTFGLSDDEGFMYQQPIFIAESPYWDLEILPQLRTQRGAGLYNVFRFVDSPTSEGSITIGGFREKQSYLDDFDIKNRDHYGAEFDYEHNNFLKNWFDWDIQGQSGVYADITYLNDVEYLNLKENDSLNYATSQQVTSRVNLFLNQDENYYGVYGKYFIDLSKDSNSETMQNLPILQYHRAFNTFLDDHLFYSFDYKGSNYYREDSKNAFQNELKIPIGLQFDLFDEYLTFSVSENIYASQISFYSSDSQQQSTKGYSSGTYSQDAQVFELNTNLVKAYDEFSHSVGLTLSYTQPGKKRTDGFYDDYKHEFEDDQENNRGCLVGHPCEFDNTPDPIKESAIDFQQFVFLADGTEKLYHRLRQPIIYESGYDTFDDLENELRYHFSKEVYFYNNTFYNYDRNTIAKTQNTLSYTDDIITFDVSHLYTDTQSIDIIGRENREHSSYLTTSARYYQSHKWQYYGGYAYDIQESETKNRYVGFQFNKKCWAVDLRYVENVRPTLNSNGRSAGIKDHVIYLTLNLTPIGGSEVRYKTSKNETDDGIRN